MTVDRYNEPVWERVLGGHEEWRLSDIEKLYIVISIVIFLYELSAITCDHPIHIYSKYYLQSIY